ncbi:hypothetical protein M0802_002904 [Mischocyttarus mexicanus]|nr:hypothetical protein M0802_002904 [Mischocyttarus mexicanus]
MSTVDVFKFAKLAKYGLLPRILSFGQRRTDGLHRALRTNSSSVATATGQSGHPRVIRASTIRQLIMELENCNSHGDHGNVFPSTPQNDNDPSGHKKWYRQASQRKIIFMGVGRRIRFPQDETIFPEESFHRNILGFNLPHTINLNRNDRSENDLESYNEGTQETRSDKRELGHR